MKKMLVLVAVLAVLGIALAVGVGSAEDSNTVNDFGTDALTVAYVYDGYCDGATLDIANGRVTGVYSSPCSTCPFTNQLYGRTGMQNGVAAAGFKYNPDTWGGLITVVRADHTWTHYLGGTVMNQGTWTACSALDGQVADNLPSSTSS